MAPFFFMVEFIFTPEQRLRAYEEGVRRQTTNETLNLLGRNRAPAKGHTAQNMHLLGAAAELAVAAYLGMEEYLFQEQTARRGSCDLPGIDVKCRSRHSYDLLVQLDDKPDKNFVLVTIENQKTVIHGWIKGIHAMKSEWIREFVPNRPCYAIPKSQLRPIEELKCLALDTCLAMNAGLPVSPSMEKTNWF